MYVCSCCLAVSDVCVYVCTLQCMQISMVYEKYVESFEKRHRIGTIHK